MDTITHAIVGAAAARATAPDASHTDALPIRQRVTIGAIAAAFPDIDYITALINPLAFIAEWHRSITHSFIMLPFWALAGGLLLAWLYGKTRHKKEIILICGLSVFSHIITDLITTWSTQIFSPISDHGFSWGLTFIIDPYFTAIILAALLISLSKKSRRVARAGILILVSYVGLQGILKYQAYNIGQEYIAWQNWHNASVNTIPQPLSPFNWKVVVAHDTQYHVAHVNLAANDSLPSSDDGNTILLKLYYHYRPTRQLDWKVYQRADKYPETLAVWNQPDFELYRKFAVLPFIYRSNNNKTEQCNWFGDLRFLLPELTVPFRYGMCQDNETNHWLLYRLQSDRKGGRELISTR